MLVLSRRVGEQIVIGNEIQIKIIAMHGNQVKIGIEAPKWLPVWRAELVSDRETAEVGASIPD